MKKINKILSLLLVVALIISPMLPASAKSTQASGAAEIKATNTSTTTINVTTGNDGDIIDGFKIVDVSISESNELTFNFTSTFEEFKSSSDKYKSLTIDEYTKEENYASDSENLKTLLGEFTAYIKTNNKNADIKSTTVSSGVATFNNVGLGQYILVGAGNSKGALVYQTVTAEVVPIVKNNNYIIYANYDVAMKTSEPNTSKSIISGTVSDNGKTSANIGDAIGYRLSASIPTYPNASTNKTFYLNDNLSNGLTLKTVPSDFIVTGYISETDATGTRLSLNNDYKITIENQNFYIDFIYDNIKQYVNVTVDYEAVLNENANIGTEVGNINSSKLVWSNSPYVGTTYETGVRPDDTNGYSKKTSSQTVYTYAVSINKYEKNNITNKLQGAEFELYDNEPATGTPIAKLTTDENGYAIYTGIAAGTYYLKEVKAPAGYKLATTITTIVISADSNIYGTVEKTRNITYTTNKDESLYGVQAIDESGNPLWIEEGTTTTVTVKETGKNYLVAYVKTIDEKVTNATSGTNASTLGNIVVDIENTKGGTLPTTGGMGTIIFTVIGLTLIIGASAILVTNKRLKHFTK